ncbi:DUF1501 domain-containing protein [Nibribacter ruber]|uniref:DUF1501 domain-containing protein n=1 Tax=Nibribacter ruber TaxID=2698458 RepID=A0A6P1P2N1_9BACT|nr:DUF1501 domain-containing protein [Nibribacter ruber]QHL88648.1 DUF1501 domain-containing protein [Nibribacter ruber]
MVTSRRDFLKHSTLASAMLFVPKFLHGMGQEHLSLLPNSNGRRLIVLQLSGGNDGLNTVVPFEDGLYYKARPALALPKNQLLTLGKEVDLGLHPAMTKMRELYDQGYLSIVNNVGYPNPDRSHFRSMDIWQTGSSATEYLNTGWLGRYLDASCSGADCPYAAIEVDDTLSLAMKGVHQKALALQNTRKFYASAQSPLLEAFQKGYQSPATHEDHHVDYLYKTLVETQASADYLYATTKTYKTTVEYPSTEIGRHLKTTAELINSGVPSRVFYASLSGFDTHVNQARQQARLLGDVSDALYALVQDLKQHHQFDNTLIFVFSEFGRRVQQNASNGTDHGTANNVFLLGGNLQKKGFYNGAPNLDTLDNGDLRYSIDFRDLYAVILRDWLKANDADILGQRFAGVHGLV